MTDIPLPGAGMGSLIKEKKRYLVIQYDNPDVDAKGTASFKVYKNELIDPVIHALGTKAKMKASGAAFIRPKERT